MRGGSAPPHPPLKSAAFAASEMMARSMGPGPGPWPWPIGPGSGPGPWALAWARCAGWLAGRPKKMFKLFSGAHQEIPEEFPNGFRVRYPCAH